MPDKTGDQVRFGESYCAGYHALLFGSPPKACAEYGSRRKGEDEADNRAWLAGWFAAGTHMQIVDEIDQVWKLEIPYD